MGNRGEVDEASVDTQNFLYSSQLWENSAVFGAGDWEERDLRP